MFAATAWAHHNMSAIYDFNDKITMTGTLSKIDWRNPHIELIVDTKNGGTEVQTWSLEGPSPSFFRARDINKSDVETALSKTVTAEASRARDGSRAGLVTDHDTAGRKSHFGVPAELLRRRRISRENFISDCRHRCRLLHRISGLRSIAERS